MNITLAAAVSTSSHRLYAYVIFLMRMFALDRYFSGPFCCESSRCNNFSVFFN